MTTDIQELFSRDPLSFTKEGGEVAKIVAKLRESRGQYNLGAMKAGTMKPVKTPKSVAALEASGVKLQLTHLLNKK